MLTTNINVIFQFEITRVYLRLGRKFSDGSTTYGTKQRISCNQFYATTSKSRPSYHRSPCIFLRAHETFSNMPQCKQRFVIEAGTDLFINKLCNHYIRYINMVNTSMNLSIMDKYIKLR